MKGHIYPKTLGSVVSFDGALAGRAFVPIVNGAAVAVKAGWVVILKAATAAVNFGFGDPIPITTTTSANHALVLGVIPEWFPDGIAVGGTGWCQIAGLHPGVLVDNQGGALTAGDIIASSVAAGLAGEGTGKVGIYVDADYDSATDAYKRVLLTNPLGLPPMGMPG
jgi:hypothetical protein